MKLLKNKQFWGALVAIGLLAFCVKDVTMTQLEEMVDRIDPIYFIPAVILTLAYIALRALRWRLLASQKKTIPIMRAISLFSAGQIITVAMPALTGQLGRVFLFANKEGMRKSFVFSTIVLEVIFDAISLVVFLLATSLAFAFPDKYRFLSIIIGGATVFVIVVLYLILHYRKSYEAWSKRNWRENRPRLYIGTKKFVRSFSKGIETLRSSQHLFGSLALSLGAWIVHMLVIHTLLLSFGFELPLAASAAVMIINTLALMIPITPGNAGTFEIAVVGALAAFSIGRADAVLFALALHFLDLFPVFVLGTLFLRSEQVSIREFKEKHQGKRILDQVTENGELVERT